MCAREYLANFQGTKYRTRQVPKYWKDIFPYEIRIKTWKVFDGKKSNRHGFSFLFHSPWSLTGYIHNFVKRHAELKEKQKRFQNNYVTSDCILR